MTLSASADDISSTPRRLTSPGMIALRIYPCSSMIDECTEHSSDALMRLCSAGSKTNRCYSSSLQYCFGTDRSGGSSEYRCAPHDLVHELWQGRRQYNRSPGQHTVISLRASLLNTKTVCSPNCLPETVYQHPSCVRHTQAPETRYVLYHQEGYAIPKMFGAITWLARKKCLMHICHTLSP